MFEISSFKRILILCVLVISLYVLYRLVVWRQTLLATDPQNVDTLLKEGFSNKGEVMATISKTNNLSLPLKEYVIYSSWNSCWDRSRITLDQLENIMIHGCRFLDFEIYNIDGKPEVGYSTNGYDASQKLPELESDTIPLFDVCNKIMEMRASGKVVNNSDPLFLHFRIKSNYAPLLEKMAEAIKGSGMNDSHILEANVYADTPLSELENKIVLLIDKGYVPFIKEKACEAGCKSDIRDMVAMYTNGDIRSNKWEYVLARDPDALEKDNTDDLRTNVETLSMVTHHLGGEYNPYNTYDFGTLIMEHKVQIIPYKFYYTDDRQSDKEYSALTEYKNFFSDNGHRAFVPMAVAYDALLHSSIR